MCDAMLTTQMLSNLFGFEGLPPQRGEDAIGPVVGRYVQPAEHLRGSNGLGVHSHFPVGGGAVTHRLHKDIDALGLTWWSKEYEQKQSSSY